MKTDVLCDDDANVRCGNCSWEGKGAQLQPIQHFDERVGAGEVCPAGECPDCGALAHVVKGKQKVRVTQVFKATRQIEFDVEVEDPNDLTEAVGRVDGGDVDVPAFEDPRWKTGWDLQNEQTELV